jgi:hypothetical protein
MLIMSLTVCRMDIPYGMNTEGPWYCPSKIEKQIDRLEGGIQVIQKQRETLTLSFKTRLMVAQLLIVMCNYEQAKNHILATQNLKGSYDASEKDFEVCVKLLARINQVYAKVKAEAKDGSAEKKPD